MTHLQALVHNWAPRNIYHNPQNSKHVDSITTMSNKPKIHVQMVMGKNVKKNNKIELNIVNIINIIEKENEVWL